MPPLGGHPDLDSAVDRLAKEFVGVFSHQTVDEVVTASRAKLGHVRIEDCVPLLSYRFATERLRASATAQAATLHAVPEVLFVCTQNSARSQLAAALLEQAAERRVVVRSAGSERAESVDLNVLLFLAERGIDPSESYSKPLVDESIAAADAVVTMGCGDACPVLPGRRYLDGDLPDPAGADLDTVRSVRDQLALLTTGLLTELTQPTSNPDVEGS